MARGPLDDVEVTVGHRIERPGAQRCRHAGSSFLSTEAPSVSPSAAGDLNAS
jgi:hypothetical protein